MADQTSRLIMQLVDRVTAPARAVTGSLRQVGEAARGLQKITGLTALTTGINASLEKTRGQLAAYHSGLLGVTASAYALSKAISSPVKAAMDFESAMADVRKVVDFDTPAAFKAFQQDVLKMSTEIPMAAKELSTIVANAGQSGIANDKLLEFTEMAAKVGVAFDISAETAGESLAKMMTALDLNIDHTRKLADAMNYLSNAQASSAKDILEFFRRAGSDGKMFGFSAVQTSAFGSAMLSAGAEADVAATSFRNMGRALVRGDAATKSQRQAFGKLGLSATKVAKAMQKDAVKTTIDVMERLNKLPKEQQAATASLLFGDEARALMPLISNLDLLKKSLGLVAKETQYAGSANAEYEVRAKTFANAVQLFQNHIERLKISFGSALMPVLNDLMDRITPIIDGLTGFVEANKELVGNAAMAVGGLVAFRIAAFAAGFAASTLKLGALLAASGLAAVGRAAMLAVAVGITPFAAAVSGLAGVLGTLTLRLFVAGRVLLASGGILAALRLSFTALVGVVTGVVGVAARLVATLLGLTGVGAVVVAVLTAIAGAAVWLYNNFDGLITFVKAFGEGFMAALGPAKGIIDPVVESSQRLYDTVASWFGPIDASGKKWAEWGKAAGEATAGWVNSATTMVTDTIDAIAALPKRVAALAAEMYAAGAALVTALWDGLKAQIDAMIAWFEGKISALAAKASSLANTLSFGWVGTPAPATPPAAPVDGKRASGGPVRAGRTYLVGERGPEPFTPAVNGFISPNSVLQPASASSASPSRSVSIGALQISLGMMAPERSVQDIAEELGWRVRQALDGVFSDATV
jgi:TP901 family phage tail tape measure protein